MSYFPAFIDLAKQKILLVGGGKIAYEKLDHLLDFTKNIEMVATTFSQAMQKRIAEEKLSYQERPYNTGDIKGYGMVIIAVDDIRLQAQIYNESKRYHCLCNAVDSIEYCDFIFPAYIKEGDLTVAISTSGASPAFAKHFKYYLKALIPAHISEFLQEMTTLRQSMQKGKERMMFLDKKAEDYIKNWSNHE